MLFYWKLHKGMVADVEYYWIYEIMSFSFTSYNPYSSLTFKFLRIIFSMRLRLILEEFIQIIKVFPFKTITLKFLFS